MKLWSNIRSLSSDERGTVTVSFGLATLALFVASGMAIDYGHWTQQKTKLQTIADSAALSASQSLSTTTWTQASLEKAAAKYVTMNGAGVAQAQVANVTVDTAAKTLSIKVQAPGQRTLSGLILTKDPLLTASAKVQYTANRGVSTCMIALDGSAAPALTGSGGTIISSPGCATQVNSASTSNISLSGGSKMVAASNCVGALPSSATVVSAMTPAPVKCTPVTDPFSAEVLPTLPTTCAIKNSFSGGGLVPAGLYCGGLTLSGGSYTFETGKVYLIKNGLFTISGTSTITTDGVTFILSGTNAGLAWSGGTSANLKAPASGPLASFAVYLDPRSTPSPAAKSVVSGNGNIKIEGIFYLPKQRLELSGGTQATGLTVFVANTFLFSGGSQFNVAINKTLTSLPIPAVLGGSSGGQTRLIN